MKIFLKQNFKAFGVFFIAVLLIYAFQQSLVLEPEQLHELKGKYAKIELKTERQYPAKIYLENDPNIYVLKRNAYKAWGKHYFLENAKAGDELIIQVQQKNQKYVVSRMRNIIEIVTMISPQNNHNYLVLKDYNNHQKAGVINIYLLCLFFLIVYIALKNIKKKTYTYK